MVNVMNKKSNEERIEERNYLFDYFELNGISIPNSIEILLDTLMCIFYEGDMPANFIKKIFDEILEDYKEKKEKNTTL